MEEINKDLEFSDLIHIVRGQQVMLDSDLAKLYGYNIKRLDEQVHRNSRRFPEDFMFRFTIEEAMFIRFQFGTL